MKSIKNIHTDLQIPENVDFECLSTMDKFYYITEAKRNYGDLAGELFCVDGVCYKDVINYVVHCYYHNIVPILNYNPIQDVQ